MLPNSAPAQSQERAAFARQLLRLLGLFGVIFATSDLLVGNYVSAVISAIIGTLSVLILWLGRQERFAALPLRVCVWLLVCMFFLGSLTQLPFHPEKGAWIPVFPFAYFYLTGLRRGAVLSLLSFLMAVVAYFLAPHLMQQQPELTGYGLSQSLGAYVLSTVIAFFYERIRTRQAQSLRLLAHHDQLTGLLNRRGFLPLAAAVLEQARRYRQPFAVVLIDIDNFKQVNDRRGHADGDLLLRQLGDLLTQNTRKADLVARWGGEEFIVLLPQSNEENARTAAHKLCAAVESQAFDTGPATASLGVAVHAPEEDLLATINRADGAMYLAKQAGKNRVVMSGGT